MIAFDVRDDMCASYIERFSSFLLNDRKDSLSSVGFVKIHFEQMPRNKISDIIEGHILQLIMIE